MATRNRSSSSPRRARSAGTRSSSSSRRARSAGSRSSSPSKRSRSSGSRSAGTRSSSSSKRSRSSGSRSSSSRRARSSGSRSSSSSKRSRSGSTTRRRSGGEQPAAFRSRRDNDSPRSRRSSRSRSASKKRSRRSTPPVTDAGERNAAYLTATVVGLTLFGLVMVLSASSVSSLYEYGDSSLSQFKKQAMWAGIGAFAFLLTSRLDYRLLRPLAKPLLLLSIALLVIVLFPGVGIDANGSTRWLGFGPFVIQPGEVAKLVLIVFAADLLARRERRMDRPELTVRPVMLVLSLFSGLLLLQPKLGTPIIMGAVVMLMLFVAGTRTRHLIGWLSAGIAVVTVAAYFATYRRERLLAFLDPWDDPLGNGLQSIQSQVGIASGGLFGVGLGASRAKWGFLPYAHSDFIYAIVAEEVGLIGASALICGFLLIGWFGLRAAMHAPDRFGTLLAAGITCWLLVQAFLNIGMVLGVAPITGEPLPFVSAGGSSLVSTLAAAGLLTSVSRRSRA